jgi:hypothetical protein
MHCIGFNSLPHYTCAMGAACVGHCIFGVWVLFPVVECLVTAALSGTNWITCASWNQWIAVYFVGGIVKALVALVTMVVAAIACRHANLLHAAWVLGVTCMAITAFVYSVNISKNYVESSSLCA